MVQTDRDLGIYVLSGERSDLASTWLLGVEINSIRLSNFFLA